ncbi:nitrite/sulfite reductase [Helicobacter sp. 23-1048]
MSGYTIPDSVTKGDFEFFKKSLNDLKSGIITKDDFKGIRVPFGVYEQRERETYMVRVKTYGGEIEPKQLGILADYADKYANKQLHITTRGGVQLHYTKLDDLCEILENLHSIGLTSRGGGGATVRNINADILSNVAGDCVFDVIPYANALTTKMLGLKDSFYLPKKFKFAFSASSADRAMATITDVGFIAKIEGGKRGFEVWVAGGMGAKPRLGFKLLDFLPDTEVFALAQAAKQIYDKHGDREKKSQARFRFVAERFGEEELAKMIFAEMEQVKKDFDCTLELESSPELPTLSGADLEIPQMSEAQQKWWNRFVIKQVQEGYFCAKVPLSLGDLKSTHARELAQRLEKIGNHSLFFAPNQNMYLRNLSAKNLLSLHDLITQFSTQSAKPAIIGDMVACTGAATCQLGIARPRGAVLKIEEYLEDKGLDLDSLQGFRIQLSGCPNSCANHFSANLGFFGKSKRNGDYSYPAYNVVIGGIVSASAEKKSRFAKKVADISAFHLPEFIYRVLAKYIPQKAQYPLFEDYVDSVGEAEIVAIAESLQEIPSFDENPAPYYDYTSDKLFGETSKERGIGEEHFKEIKPN